MTAAANRRTLTSNMGFVPLLQFTYKWDDKVRQFLVMRPPHFFMSIIATKVTSYSN